MSLQGLPSSFRDPAGFVFASGGRVRRAVTAEGKEDYDRLISSGLYAELVKRKWIVSHEESTPSDPGIHRVLSPEQIPFISYPYEWSFSQLKDAAILTLRIQSLALSSGMSLKDASPYNVQFHRGRPILIDTLSFEKLKPSPWVAYKQFCEMFLAPLALMAFISPKFNRYLATDVNGVDLALASRILPLKTWFKPACLLHIHLHAMSQTKHAGSAAASGNPAFSVTNLLAINDSLLSGIQKMTAGRAKTEWGGYYSSLTHYSGGAETFKAEKIGEWLKKEKPRSLLDLGGNNGKYGRLATAQGIATVCADMDPVCIEENYLLSQKNGDVLMLPLLLDLSNPSPSLGWAGEERPDFFARVKTDMTMALALVHHLRIGLNVPLAHIARFFSGLGSRALIIEFVPKSDPMTKKLLSTREDCFGDYRQDVFEKEFGAHFSIAEKTVIPETERTLYLMVRREKPD